MTELKKHIYNESNRLMLDGTPWLYLADLNKQIQSCLECIID